HNGLVICMSTLGLSGGIKSCGNIIFTPKTVQPVMGVQRKLVYK
ncbi:unnamed protein product, partial [Allacma fusca]